MSEPSTGRTALLRPCLGCGTPVETTKKNAGARCDSCSEEHGRQFPKARGESHKESSARRGYDYRWRRLSAQARREHPFCMDCGTHEDLTADHLRWPARTLADVEVVCRSCNSRRGALRTNGNATAVREPLHGYASPLDDTWGCDPLGGGLDPRGGSRTLDYSSEDSASDPDSCSAVHGDAG